MKSLLLEICWGDFSCVKARNLAEAGLEQEKRLLRSLGKKENLVNKCLAKFAGLGTEGRNEHNLRREINTNFIKAEVGHLITFLEDSEAARYMVKPHVFLGWLHDNYPKRFQKQV